MTSTLVTADSLKGRVGLSADYGRSWTSPSGQLSRSNVYGIVSLTSEFRDGTLVEVAGTPFANAGERGWGGLGFGGTYSWRDNKYALHGELNADTSLTHFAQSFSLNGTAGFSFKW